MLGYGIALKIIKTLISSTVASIVQCIAQFKLFLTKRLWLESRDFSLFDKIKRESKSKGLKKYWILP